MWPFRKKSPFVRNPATISIEVSDQKDGRTAVFIAVYDADVEVDRNGKTEFKLHNASLDIYLGGPTSQVKCVIRPDPDGSLAIGVDGLSSHADCVVWKPLTPHAFLFGRR